MAVRRMNSIQGYALPQQEGLFSVPGRQQLYSPYSSRQVQDWTRGLNAGTLALVMILFFGVLFSDLQALNAGGQRIGQLSEGIASLEDNNALLQAQLETSLLNVARSATVSTLTLPGSGTLTGSAR